MVMASNMLCIIHSKHIKDPKLVKLGDASAQKIRESAKIRIMYPDKQVDLLKISKDLPQELSQEKHAFHMKCYRLFTNTHTLLATPSTQIRVKNARKRMANDEDNEENVEHKKRKPNTKVLFPKRECLFCSKDTKSFLDKSRMVRVKECLTRCQTTIAENSIRDAAKEKSDDTILRKIAGVSMIAREAHYHQSCRKEYTRRLDRNKRRESTRKSQAVLKERNTSVSSAKAFEDICSYVSDRILTKGCVETLALIREKYLLFLNEENSKENSPCKPFQLKMRLKNRFRDQVKFHKIDSKTELLFSDKLTVERVCDIFSNTLSSEQNVKTTAIHLRRQIVDAWKSKIEGNWPPTVEELSCESLVPKLLTEFLTSLITGGDTAAKTVVIESLAQDICYAVSNGQWQQPKHLTLGVAIRHITGSASLISLMNKYGHCISYSEVINLENAVCDELDRAPSILPPTISRDNNSVLHFCWDNFDLNEETPSGAGSTHSVHGIILQDTGPTNDKDTGQDAGHRYDKEIRPDDKKSDCTTIRTKRKVQLGPMVPEVFEPLYIKGNPGPSFNVNKVSVEDCHETLRALREDFCWMICRNVTSDNQRIPGWGGWVELTAKLEPEPTTTIDYMPPLISPITENATVREVLDISQRASREVGQASTIVTFDLAAAKKAFNIVWQNPMKYNDVLVRLGVFHIICAYLKAVGKYLRGCGFEEVLTNSGICAGKSVEGVLSVKHYNRGLRVHKIVSEVIQRMMFSLFSKIHPLSKDVEELMDELIESPDRVVIERTTNNHHFIVMFSDYCDFKKDILDGKLGKTQQYWGQYSEFILFLQQFIRATKEGNYPLHVATLQKLCPMFFAFDQQNYARYMTAHFLELVNLPERNPDAERLLNMKGFSVARTSTPSARTAVDITIEQTINRHAKTHGGITGFSRKYSAYHRWCKTRHHRASFAQFAYTNAGIFCGDENQPHSKDMRVSQVKQSEQDVKNVERAFEEFIQPFEIEEKEYLYCLSSGVVAPENVANDLLNAYAIGEQAFNKFMTNRFLEKSEKFNQPIKRQNLKTFSTMGAKSTVKSSFNKEIEIRAGRNLFGQLLMISQDNNISIEKLLEFPLGPVPWALATQDGMPTKTSKSSLQAFIEKTCTAVDMPPVESCCSVIDGNALLYQIPQQSTFEEVAAVVFRCLPKTKSVHFITDTYKSDSIKEVERTRRGSGSQLLLKGPKTQVPRDWKSFLSNPENKTNLITFFLKEWKKPVYAPIMQGRDIMFVCGEKVICMSSNGTSVHTKEEHSLESDQEEADTRLLLHTLYLDQNLANEDTIIIRSSDTDVFVLLVHYAKQIMKTVLLDTGTGNHRRLLDITSIADDLGIQLSNALPGFHALTGCDTVSSFTKKGKVMPFKLLKKSEEHQQILSILGESMILTEEGLENIEKFVCAMYGSPKQTNINKVRYTLFSQYFKSPLEEILSYDGKGRDLSLLPPCRSSLRKHIARANYQAYIWKHSHIPEQQLPSPNLNGWQIQNSKISIDWVDDKILPQDIIDVLAENTGKDLTWENKDEDDQDEVRSRPVYLQNYEDAE